MNTPDILSVLVAFGTIISAVAAVLTFLITLIPVRITFGRRAREENIHLSPHQSRSHSIIIPGRQPVLSTVSRRARRFTLLLFAIFLTAAVALGALALRIETSHDVLHFGEPTMTTVTSQPCQPKPCAAYNGVLLLIGAVDRSHQMASPAAGYPPRYIDPGFHIVRVEVSFLVTSGEHTIGANDLVLNDATGHEHWSDAWDDTCRDSFGSFTIGPGGQVGPIPLCFAAGDPATAPLTLIWRQESSYQELHIALP